MTMTLRLVLGAAWLLHASADSSDVLGCGCRLDFCCAHRKVQGATPYPIQQCYGPLGYLPTRYLDDGRITVWWNWLCAEVAAGNRSGSSSPCDVPELRGPEGTSDRSAPIITYVIENGKSCAEGPTCPLAYDTSLPPPPSGTPYDAKYGVGVSSRLILGVGSCDTRRLNFLDSVTGKEISVTVTLDFSESDRSGFICKVPEGQVDEAFPVWIGKSNDEVCGDGPAPEPTGWIGPTGSGPADSYGTCVDFPADVGGRGRVTVSVATNSEEPPPPGTDPPRVRYNWPCKVSSTPSPTTAAPSASPAPTSTFAPTPGSDGAATATTAGALVIGVLALLV